MAADPLAFDLNGIRVHREARDHGRSESTQTSQQMVVAPFTVVVDSREQLPYEFSGMDMIVPTVTAGLPSGDYSIQGMEGQVACERKSMDDLFSSVTWGRDRFLREIERLNDLKAAFVVIEATWPEIMEPLLTRPGWINQTEPKSVEGTIVAWSIRYRNVSWWACGSRRDAEQRTFSILRHFWREVNP